MPILGHLANRDSDGGYGVFGGSDASEGSSSLASGDARHGRGELAPTAMPSPGPLQSVLVAGLPMQITEEGVREIFSTYGLVQSLKVFDGGRGDKAAVVRMADPHQAQWIVENLNNNIPAALSGFLSTPLTIRYADSRTERSKLSGVPKAESQQQRRMSASSETSGSSSQGSWSSQGLQPRSDAEDPLPEMPRKPLCSCCARCSGRNVTATHEELQEVMKVMRQLTLTEDCVVGGELINKGAYLLRVGKRWRRLGWEYSPELEEEAREIMQEGIDDEQAIRIRFKVPRQPMPWCCILRCPCAMFCFTFLCVMTLCASGITGAVSIDTNFDSFMDSDSESSLQYNSMLIAMQDRKDKNSRRLRRRLQREYAEPEESRSQEVLWLDVLRGLVRPWDHLRFTDSPHSPALFVDDVSDSFEESDSVADRLEEAEWLDQNMLRPAPMSAAEVGGNTSSSEGRRLQGPALYKQFKIQITYVTKNKETVGEGNMLSNEMLSLVHSLELKIKEEVMNYKKICGESEMTSRRQCEPGVSLANIAFAFQHKESSAKNILYFNGTGARPIPVEFTVKFAQDQGILPLFFPSEDIGKRQGFHVEGLPCMDVDQECSRWKEEDQCKPFATYESYMRDFCPLTCGYCGNVGPYKAPGDATSTEPKPVVEAIRSHFIFQAFCCHAYSPNRKADLAKLNTDWADLVGSFVSVLRSKDDETEQLRIFFNGDGVEGYEAMAAVQNDLLWALGSYVFVLFYATLHTRSIFLACLGLFLVMLSIPCALSIFSHASGMQTISLMSCLSIFIVIGIGSDMLFVYTDFWKQSIQHSRDPVKRLKFTYLQASTSTAATTFTTAMSFLANLASVLRPLREFGFFMGACVVSAWLIMFFGYPPILVIGERCHRRCQRCLHNSGKEKAAEEQAMLSGAGRRNSVAIIHRRSSVAVAAMLDPEKKGVGEMHQNLLGSRFAGFVHDWKVCLLIVFIVGTGGSLMLAMRNLEQAGGVPQIFPPEHNQVLGKEYDGKFNNFDLDIAAMAKRSVAECADLFQECNIYKCETTGRAMGSPTVCQCFPQGQPKGVCTTLSRRKINLRIMARHGLPADAVDSANFTGLMSQQFPNGKVKMGKGEAVAAECLVENWESGLQQLAEVWTVPQLQVTMPNSAPQLCESSQVCYCGIARCEGSSTGISYGNLELGPVQLVQQPDAGRRLTQRFLNEEEEWHPKPVRPELQVDVNIVFGIKVTGKNPLLGEAKEKPYEFDPAFNIADPWAQRKFLDLCENWMKLPIRKELAIFRIRCWLTGFKSYWVGKGKDWPVRPNLEDTHAEIYWYATNMMTDGFQTNTFFWFSPDKKVQATYVPFFLSEPNTISSSKAMELKGKWDKAVEDNPMPYPGAWHASRLWVRAEAEKVILDSTLVTLGISLGCVFLGIFVFTRSMHLAFLVMIVVMSIIICLLFFMTVIMKWPIGAIEVLSLIVFVGFAVDYCLHIAHKYHTCHINSVVEDTSGDDSSEPTDSPMARRSDSGSNSGQAFTFQRSLGRGSATSSRPSTANRASITVTVGDRPSKKHPLQKAHTTLLVNNRPEERFSRARYALERMGGAVVGSACTTMGCAAFLLPCQLAVFTKIGSVVMAVTIYAIIYTLLPLPALLMQCGPCSHDLAALQEWIMKLFHDPPHRQQRGPMLGPLETKKDENLPRRYVLHMPTKGMAQIEAGTPATRTRVTATG